MTIKNNLLFILLPIVSLVACTNRILFEQNKDFVNEKWHKDSTLVFNVEIDDTNQIYHVFFNTRITGNYNYRNMFLFIDTEVPNNVTIRDTLECVLSKASGEPYGKPDGNWLGKGLGHIWAYKIGYKTYIRFPYKGTYTFTIQQAMRPVELEHVLDAGISIEKAKQ